jgi:predicted ABC-type ATPase
MSDAIPRLRMFAGPNGSGKSTINGVIRPELLGVYINPDEIEKTIRERGDFLDLASYRVRTAEKEILTFFQQSTLLEKADLLDEADALRFSDDKLSFFAVSVNAYFASVAADFIRQKLLVERVSFTFETVMSSPDKVAFLKKAQQFGYRTYLYYVATEDPDINISRVRYRVKMGGHPVPEDKIVSRYYRSLDLLKQAIGYTYRTYIFDNSGQQQVLVAEITDGHSMELKSGRMPNWFKHAVLDKIGIEP